MKFDAGGGEDNDEYNSAGFFRHLNHSCRSVHFPFEQFHLTEFTMMEVEAQAWLPPVGETGAKSNRGKL